MNKCSIGFVLTLLTRLFLSCAAQDASAESEPAAHKAPSWLRDGIVYEVFPRDFSSAGNLNGVTARLDELKDLGVTILWLMPINPIGMEQRKGSYGSPYAARDYYAVNPDYGTTNDLKRLILEAHKRDMKVILDIVLLHTAWDSVMISHPEFYKHNAQGKIIRRCPSGMMSPASILRTPRCVNI